MRADGGRIIGSLARIVGLDAAQDALGDACEVALRTWVRDGVPREPRAWLIVTARHRALDAVRREAKRAGKEADGATLMALSSPEPAQSGAVADDLLRLIFTCCHPALGVDARVALTLRVVCGLPTADVAAALLVSEATMAKRLTRAKRKIDVAAIPYRVPSDADLPARLGAVCAVVHLVYTNGHTPPHGDAAIRVDLCGEAIRLARLLLELLPDEATAMGLLALLLLSHARHTTRFDDEGEPVLLADAERTKWDHELAAEGHELLVRSLRRTDGLADAYQLQAAIAAGHTLAPTYEDTDWAEIARLYDILEQVAPGPVVRLNRAVAVAERDGPRAGLDLLAADPVAASLLLAPVVRGELLARAGEAAAALAEFGAALLGDLSPAQARWVRRRVTELGADPAAPPG